MANVTPWQYGLSEEDWKKLQPGAGLGDIASALTTGQEAFNKAKMQQLQEQQAKLSMSPKPLMKVTSTGATQIGELPVNAEVAPTSQTKTAYTFDPTTGQAKAITDSQGNPIEMGIHDTLNKPTGNAAVKITKETAKGIADAIKSGKYPPAIVSKWFTPGRSGAGLENSNMILENLGFTDPVTGEPGEFDLTDYTQSYNQEQKNKVSYANSQNAIKDMGLLVKSAEKLGNGKFSDWNRAKLNWQGRTGNEAVAAFKASAQAAIDSISLALGPAGGTGATDERLKLAKRIVDEAQSVDQIKAALEETRLFVENRKQTFAHEGLAGFRERNGLAANYTAPKESESFLPQEGTKIIGGVTYKKVKGGWEAQ